MRPTRQNTDRERHKNNKENATNSHTLDTEWKADNENAGKLTHDMAIGKPYEEIRILRMCPGDIQRAFRLLMRLGRKHENSIGA